MQLLIDWLFAGVIAVPFALSVFAALQEMGADAALRAITVVPLPRPLSVESEDRDSQANVERLAA